MNFIFLEFASLVSYIMKEVAKRIVSILLVGLLLAEISAFHIYQHDDSSNSSYNDCEICILVFESQELEGIIFPFYADEYAPLEVQSRFKISSFTKTHIDPIKEGIPYSRPPPFKFA